MQYSRRDESPLATSQGQDGSHQSALTVGPGLVDGTARIQTEVRVRNSTGAAANNIRKGIVCIQYVILSVWRNDLFYIFSLECCRPHGRRLMRRHDFSTSLGHSSYESLNFQADDVCPNSAVIEQMAAIRSLNTKHNGTGRRVD